MSCRAAASGTFALNTPALLREARGGLAAAGRLGEYRGYLARARAAKALAGGAAAAQLEREVLAQARIALGDVRELTKSAVTVVRALRRGGRLDRVSAALKRRVGDGLQTRRAWEEASASDEVKTALGRAGVDDVVAGALDEGMRAVDARLTAHDSRITVEGTAGGRAGRIVLGGAPPAPPSSLRDLLGRGRFDALAGAVERGEPAYLEGVLTGAGDARAEDLVLLGALDTLRQGTRHVRKLEDAGLAVHEGAEPGTAAVIAGIALAALIIGVLIMIAACPDNGEGEPDLDAGGPACGIGVLLFLLSLVTFGLLKDSQTQDPRGGTNVALGSPVVRGVVRDLEMVRA